MVLSAGTHLYAFLGSQSDPSAGTLSHIVRLHPILTMVGHDSMATAMTSGCYAGVQELPRSSSGVAASSVTIGINSAL